MEVQSSLRACPPSEAVVERVAAREGVDPTELGVPLFESIDPDSLDRLVREASSERTPPIRVEFTYYGYDVTVASDGSVTVSEQTRDR